jgi:hypothetical protein
LSENEEQSTGAASAAVEELILYLLAPWLEFTQMEGRA